MTLQTFSNGRVMLYIFQARTYTLHVLRPALQRLRQLTKSSIITAQTTICTTVCSKEDERCLN